MANWLFLSVRVGEGEDPFRNCFGKGRNFPKYLFHEVAEEEVRELPGDIDGKKIYLIKIDKESSFAEAVRDKRYFSMSYSKVKGAVPLRRRGGKCQGGFACPNSSCVKLLCSLTSTPNKSQFCFKEGVRVCFSCGTPVVNEPCYARKMAELINPTTVKVYHLGQHTCTPKIGPSRLEEQELVERVKAGNLLPTKQIQKKGVFELISAGRVAEAFAEGRKVSDTNRIRSIKKGQKLVANPNSFETLEILKAASDKVDKFLIWKINLASQSNDPDYVFCMSSCMAKIAIQMDVGADRENGCAV